MGTKLHELLAVNGNLAGQATKVRTELAATFKGKRHLFEEKRKSFTSSDENTPAKVEEQSDIQSTVADEIAWITPHLAKSLNVAYQVDLANTEARADVLLEDGTVLLTQIPATTLLQLEKRIAEWKELIASIPTLDPAKGFRPDTDRGAGYYKARDVEKDREKPDREVVVLYPAVDKHPAQVQLVDVRRKVGTILEQEWSALITPAKKAELLENVEDLFRAATKARAKANEHAIETADKKIGETLLGFVFKPLQTA